MTVTAEDVESMILRLDDPDHLGFSDVSAVVAMLRALLQERDACVTAFDAATENMAAQLNEATAAAYQYVAHECREAGNHDLADHYEGYAAQARQEGGDAT